MEQAQATAVVNDSAGNVQDFQPQGENPQGQTAQMQQQNSNLQTPGSIDILNNQNVRIVVPNDNATTAVAGQQTEQNTTVAKSGVADIVWVVALVLVLIYSVLFLAHRRRHTKEEAASEKVVTPEIKESPPPAKKPKKAKKKSRHRKRR